MTERFRILAIIVLMTLIPACTSPATTPIISTSTTLPNPTKEPALENPPTATDTPLPTTTPEPPDLAKFYGIYRACPTSSALKFEPGVTFGILSDVAHECYGWVSPDVSKEEGLLSHLKIIYKIFDGTTMPERDAVIDQEVEIFINSSPENLDLLGIFLPPTPTPLPYSHKAFDVEIIGVNEHGAMLELIYNGDIGDLTELTIKAELLQNRKFKEEQVFNTLDNKLLAELTDAIYDLGELTVKLQFPQDLESLGASEIELKIDYGRLFPWMHYIYGDSRLAYRFSYPWDPDHLEAWDLQPISDDFPDGDGHPVTPPCEGTVVRSEVIPGSKGTNNMVIYCEDTGYYVQLGHMDRQVFIGDHVTTDTIAGYLHWEEIISRPHNHTKLRRLKIIKTDHSSSIEANDYVDMFNPHVQLGGEALPFGFWLEDTLPEEVKILIEKGVFQWPEYLLPKE